jgi:hypothetical protein
LTEVIGGDPDLARRAGEWPPAGDRRCGAVVGHGGEDLHAEAAEFVAGIA